MGSKKKKKNTFGRVQQTTAYSIPFFIAEINISEVPKFFLDSSRFACWLGLFHRREFSVPWPNNQVPLEEEWPQSFWQLARPNRPAAARKNTARRLVQRRVWFLLLFISLYGHIGGGQMFIDFDLISISIVFFLCCRQQSKLKRIFAKTQSGFLLALRWLFRASFSVSRGRRTNVEYVRRHQTIN